jgi:hypothetical protein
MNAIVGVGVIALLVLIAIIVVDAVSGPTPGRGLCIFQDRILLPDRCVSGCRECPECPTAATRPYLIFWTEAASCPDACICP